MSLAFKIATFAAALLFAATTILFVFVRQDIESAVLLRDEERLNRVLNQAATEFRMAVAHAESDVRVAASAPSVAGVIEAIAQAKGNPERAPSLGRREDALAEYFRAVLKANDTYLQVRLIGTEGNGREIVRLEKTATGVVRVQPNDLQPKGDRPYFKKAIALSPGVVYLSDITLNQEHGKVAEPHQPVLRVATVVTDRHGDVFGILVINVDFNATLAELDGLSVDGLRLHMTTAHGDYLIAADPQKVFGFDLGHRYRIQEDFPLLGKKLLDDAVRGISRNNRDDKFVARAVTAQFNGGETQQAWVLIGTIDLKHSTAEFFNFQYRFLGVVLVLLALGILGSVIFARHMTAPLRRLSAALRRVGAGEFLIAIEKDYVSDPDISDLRRAYETMREAIQHREQSLQDARAQTDAVLESTVNPIITIDDRGHILHVNEATCRTLGYTAQEMEGHNVSMLMPSPYKEAHNDYMSRYLETGEAKVIGKGREVFAQRKDGRILPVDLGIAEVALSSGRIFVGTLTDLSEIKALQASKLAKMETELKVEQMKGAFVATINHELRTPLTSIIGSLALVRSSRLGELPVKAKSMIDIAHTNSERLAHLVNDILDIEKVASGNMEFHIERIDVATLISDAIIANAGYAGGLDIKLRAKPMAECLFVRSDHDRLLQVLANLISNAVKYSPKHGNVSLSAKRQCGCARICVSDKGPGIPKEFRRKMFSRFCQADSTDARKKGGTGLGLNIAKSIVEALGGSIGYHSIEGRGATFYIDFPIDARAAGENAAQASNGLAARVSSARATSP